MTKKKILVATLLFIFAISSCCFATDNIATNNQEVQDTLETTEETPLITTQDGEILSDDDTASTSDNWVNGDLYKFGDKVTVDGVVDGNAFIMAQEVTISAEIGGDLFVMANKLTIDGGYVYSSTFAMANEIVINGITYDLYAIGNKITLDNDGFIYRDMRVAGNEINLKGRVRRNAFIESNEITFDESVGTLIYGDLEYSSDEQEYNVPEGVVAGDVKYTQSSTGLSEEDVTLSVGAIILAHVLKLIKVLVTTLAITLLLIFLAPKFITKISQMSVKKSLVSFGIGFVSPAIIIVAAIVLFILMLLSSMIFIDNLVVPVACLLIVLFILLSICATAVTSVYFGKLISKLANKDGKLFVILFSLLVATAIWVLSLIPILGDLVSYCAWAFGIGIILVNLFYRKKNKEEVKE